MLLDMGYIDIFKSIDKIIYLSAKEINGEDKRNGRIYIVVLWLVSILAMVTNSIKATGRKILSPKKSFMQILWEMGRDEKHFSSWFVDKPSDFNHLSKTGAAGWRSLQVFYNYYDWVLPRLKVKNNIEKKLTQYWIGKMENRQAVSNRKKIVVQLLVKSFWRFKCAGESEIRLLSIASGSAQAVLEAMEKVPFNVKVILIDNDPTALAEARRVIKKKGLEKNFMIIKGTASIIEKVCKDFTPHIIEMVGFLDYRPMKKAIRLIKRIRNILPEKGMFFTCNIIPNKEKIFLDWVLLWPMIYRRPKEFKQILEKAGFVKNKIFLEPLNIHAIGVCEK